MARNAETAAQCGLVQVIHLRWTKASRGGEGARARAAVPAAFELPAAELAGAQRVLCVDTWPWGENNAFAEASPRRQRVPLAGGYSYGCVTISAHVEGLHVAYQYDRSHGGAPDRHFYNPVTDYGQSPSRTLLVRDRQWVRVCYNGRFSGQDCGNWWYEQTTVNVAWFADEPNGRIFLDQQPAEEFRSLADLW